MKKRLKQVPEYRLILMLLFLALLLRLPWLYTTIEKDEGQFGYTAWSWMSGERLYADLKDNKPPLLYMAYALPIFLFGNSIIPVRLMNDILFLISIIFFFKLTKNLFSKKTALFSTLFYALFMNIPVFEGYLAMSESLLTPFLIVSVYFFERYVSTKKPYLIFASSIFALVSLLIKQQAIFLFFFLISGLFIYKEKNKIRKAVFVILIPVVVIIFLLLSNKQLVLGLLQRTWLELTDSPMGFASGYQPFQYNLLIIIEGSVLLLFSIVGLIRVLRAKMSERGYFLLCWLFIALLFTLIPPAYGHYYILLMPQLSIFAGLGLNYSIRCRKNKKLFIFLVALLFTVTSLLVIKHFPNSTINTKYFGWGLSNFESYDQQVGLASFIKNTTYPEDKILIVGWEPAIYWLSERRPPRDFLAYSSPDTFNLSQLEKIMKKERLPLVLVFKGHEEFNKQFDFLSNKKTVYGVEVYEITLNEDHCYMYILRKREDKKICDLISTPFLKQICSAVISSDFQKCYNITDPLSKNVCLIRVAVKNGDPNNCPIMEDYNSSYANFCISNLNGKFDRNACVDSLKPEYGDKMADYFCRRRYAIFMNDTLQCEQMEDNDQRLFCKEGVTLDKSYCEAIVDRMVYSWCMVDATSNPDYCNL